MLAICAALLLPATVSFEANSVAVGELVASIAKQAGMRLESAKDVALEPLTVQFKDRPVDEVLTKIAEVVKAEWVPASQTLVLSRSVSLARQQEAAEQSLIGGRVSAMLLATRNLAEGSVPLDRARALLYMDRYRLAQMGQDALLTEFERMAQSNPAAKAASRMMAEVPKDLVAMKLRDRIVFSDKPTPAQKQLPAKTNPALATLLADLKLLEEAKAKIGVRKNQRLVNFGGMPSTGPALLRDGYGKTLLVVERRGPLIYSWSLVMVAKDGAGLLTASGRIPRQTGALFQASHKGKDLALTDEQSAFAELWNIGYMQAMTSFGTLPDGTKISGSFAVSTHESKGKDTLAPVRHLLLDPVTNDPTGILVGSLIRQLAGSRPLIASIPDSSIGELARRINQDKLKTLNDVQESLEQVHSPAVSRLPLARFRTADDWMLVEPYLPVGDRKVRATRAPLRDLMRRIKSEGTLTLNAASAYFRASGTLPSFGSLELIYASNADLGIDSSAAQGVFNASLPFLASLSSGQWESAKDGLTRAEMTTQQKAVISHWALIDLAQSYLRLVPQRGTQMGFERHYPLDIEPTEMFPRGVPSTAVVTIATMTRPVVLARASNGFSFAMDAESLGLFESLLGDPVANPGAAARNLETYRMAQRVGYTVEVQLTDALAPRFDLSEVKAVTGTAFGPKEKLPASFLKRSEEAKAAFHRPPNRGGGT